MGRLAASLFSFFFSPPTLLWTFSLLLLGFASPSLAANECTFVKSHKNQECVYNIHLSQSPGRCGSSGGHGRRHFRRHLSGEELGGVETGYVGRDGKVEKGEGGEEDGDPGFQNDYDRKIDNMEKSFFFMKDDHDRRLQHLEGTVRDLLDLDLQPSSSKSSSSSSSSSSASSPLTSLLKTTVHLASPGQGTVTLEEGKRKLDANILNRMHDEFSKLRQELREKTELLFDAQIRANETETLLEKSQVDIFSVNQDLLTAQHRIALLERERAVLHNQLKDRNYKLDVANGSLSELEQKFEGQQKQLLKLVRSENTLTENLMTCELVLNSSKEELGLVEKRHKELKTLYTRTKTVLGIRETELIGCYAAKTQTFCGFEHANLCGFTQPNDTSDFFDWEWGKGDTPSRGTGPDGDHTCGAKTGHFMFIEASAKSRGMNAIIYSPLYRGMEQQCLEFYYHMNGRHIGTLNVYAKARGAELASVWRAYGNQGDIWSVARLAIPRQLARAGYQIAFEGITENGYQGDMAIDDVTVTDGKCPEGVQAIEVSFNVTGSTDEILEEGKKFARILRTQKLGKIKKNPRKKGKGKDAGGEVKDSDKSKGDNDAGVKDSLGRDDFQLDPVDPLD